MSNMLAEFKSKNPGVSIAVAVPESFHSFLDCMPHVGGGGNHLYVFGEILVPLVFVPLKTSLRFKEPQGTNPHILLLESEVVMRLSRRDRTGRLETRDWDGLMPVSPSPSLGRDPIFHSFF